MYRLFKHNPVFRNSILMVGFGLLSLLLGEIKITIPGMAFATSDLREIALFASVIFLRNPGYLVGVALITSLSIPEGGSYYGNIFMQTAAILSAYFVYIRYLRKINNYVRKGFLWAIMIVLNYYVVLLPTLVLSSVLFGSLQINEFFSGYITIISIIHFEILITVSLTTMVVVSNTVRRELVTKNRELFEAKKRAEQSDNLKTEFLTQMSHEIRTPLNSIISFSGLLKEIVHLRENDDYTTIFQSITKSCNRIIRTIELILNLSQMKTKSYDCKFIKLNLYSDIINRHIENILENAAAKNLTVRYSGVTNIELYLDEYSANLIFEHLLDNAVKYTESGGIIVKVDYRNERPIIEISDTGIGISEEYLPRLFDPFTQEEQGYTRTYDGNGLGLSLVKTCCELNNADISVTSKKGEGTRFTIEFRDKVNIKNKPHYCDLVHSSQNSFQETK